MTGCKTPQATKVTDRVKAHLPSQYQPGQHSPEDKPQSRPGAVLYRSGSHRAHRYGLANNQDLSMTLQQIAMAKSSVLF
jgi:hypothetical protein